MPASQHQQWVPLEQIVYSYLDRSEQPPHKFYKCWQIAFKGMDDMGMDFFYAVKSVKLPVMANLTVPLPSDYLNYTKVGVFNQAGEVIPLMYNSKLTNYADLNSNRLQKTQDNTLFSFFLFNSPVFYNYWNGDVFENLYGLSSGAPFIGDFKIDNANGVIVLSEFFIYPYILLEYVASPQEGQQYFVPAQFETALMSYIAWQDIAFLSTSRRGNLGDKADRRHNYFNERRLAKARYDPVDLATAFEEGLRAQRMVVKG